MSKISGCNGAKCKRVISSTNEPNVSIEKNYNHDSNNEEIL